MEARIKHEMEEKPASEIVELNLDGTSSGGTVAGLTDEFTSLETLSLNNCGLTSLKGFPKLPALKNLELGDNKIKEGFADISHLSNLVFLNLADNPIQNVDELKTLGKIETLNELDLFSVDISIGKGKREKIFKLIPSLVYLDGCDKFDKPKEECDEEEDGNNEELEDEELDDDEELEEEDEEEEASLKDLYNKSLNDTEEDDADFEGEGEEDDDVDEEFDEEEDEEEDVKNLSKESIGEPRKKKQKVAPKENGKATAK